MSDTIADHRQCHAAASFGEMLRCFRERRLWTQATLAERAGLPEKTVSALETGARRRPHLTTLELLADALELDAADRDALRAGRDGVPQSPRPAPAPVPPPLSPALPLPASPFVGRDASVREVIARLSQPENRLITLTGTGGIGKTRLALHVAATVAERYPNGVLFVDMAALRDPLLVPGAIAQALGLRLAGGQSAESAVLDALAGARALLVLDNLEQVLSAGPFIDRLVTGCPELTVLVTSRERLALARERTFLVGGLALPESGAGFAESSVSEAVQFFADRARAAQPAFTVSPGNAADIAAICAGLDGIPLAIELAAARLAHVGAPNVLRERLDRRLTWLTSGLRDAQPRHRTMRAAIEWSYDALDPADQVLFRRLAAFAGGFTLDAVEALGDALAESGAVAVLDVDATLDGIASLVEKHLLQLYDGPDGGTRYRMLETIRDFGVDRLRENDEEVAVRAAHLATYLALAERGEDELNGPDQRAWLARLGADGDNIRAALSWAIARGDAERAARLGSALWRVWAVTGRVEEGHRLLARALALEGPTTPAVRAKALRRLGNLAVELADYAGAREAFAASLELARATGDEPARLRALSSVGFAASNLGAYGEARAYLEEALASWVGPEAAADRAATLYSLAMVELAEGRLREAEERYRAALHLRRSLSDEAGAAHCLIGLGQLAYLTEQHPDARSHVDKALEMFRSIGDRDGEGRALLELARLARADGDIHLARGLAFNALADIRGAGDQQGMADALEVTAMVAWDAGDVADGARLAGTAAAWRRERRVPLTPPLRARYAALLTSARAALGGRPFDEAMAEGETMSLERAAADWLAAARESG